MFKKYCHYFLFYYLCSNEGIQVIPGHKKSEGGGGITDQLQPKFWRMAHFFYFLLRRELAAVCDDDGLRGGGRPADDRRHPQAVRRQNVLGLGPQRHIGRIGNHQQCGTSPLVAFTEFGRVLRGLLWSYVATKYPDFFFSIQLKILLHFCWVSLGLL